MMYVYSGKCRQGDCGDKTKFKDISNKKLFVGDIVLAYTRNSKYVSGLTVVVSDKYTSYVGGEHRIKKGKIVYFVMGIKKIDFMKDDSEWIVQKVKDYDEVVDGENWKEYGFSYKTK